MKLLKNQKSAKDKLLKYKVGALFMEAGTGKTRVALELVNDIPDIDLVVWVAPLRSIEPIDKDVLSIKDEISKWDGFNAPKVIYKGIESIQASDRHYLEVYNAIKNAKKPFLIVDESIKIKNFEAKRTKRLLELGRMVEYKLILNGAPITRDLLDIWAQIQFLDPEILNMDIAEFKTTFCKYTTITKRLNGRSQYTREFITGYENIDYLYSLIGRYVYECDLSLNIEQIFEIKKYDITKDERELYSHLKKTYLDNEMLIAMNNSIFLEMTQKMQHSYCVAEDKFNVVDKWIKDESKTIIFCKYVASAEACKKRYPKALVLNYKTGSMSLNLQDRPYTVYFDQTWDYGDVAQSQHRNYRTGQKNDCRYLKLVGNIGLDNLIAKNNEKKVSLSEYFKFTSKENLKKEL